MRMDIDRVVVNPEAEDRHLHPVREGNRAALPVDPEGVLEVTEEILSYRRAGGGCRRVAIHLSPAKYVPGYSLSFAGKDVRPSSSSNRRKARTVARYCTLY